jgi:hypothetical protein
LFSTINSINLFVLSLEISKSTLESLHLSGCPAQEAVVIISFLMHASKKSVNDSHHSQYSSAAFLASSLGILLKFGLPSSLYLFLFFSKFCIISFLFSSFTHSINDDFLISGVCWFISLSSTC